MNLVVELFLFASLLFYLLFGGADFGAGILELFSRKRNRPATAQLTYRVIGPVWEANHIWLIIVLVILWTGFPEVYTRISTNLHLPLLGLLLAIIFRGTAFVFRHYDAIKDESHALYNKLFRYSSFFASFFIGVIAAAVVMGRLSEDPSDFAEGYILPWLNGFSFMTGFFVVSLHAYLASVYLIAEAQSDRVQQERYIAKTKFISQTTVALGLLVFATAYAYKVPLLEDFIKHPLSLAAIVLSTATLPLFWNALRRGKYVQIRALAGLQATLILGAWVIAQYPVMIKLADAEALSVSNTIANPRTIELLGWALILAGILILPGLYHLLKSFNLIKTES